MRRKSQPAGRKDSTVMHPLIAEIERAQRKENVPVFDAGDTVKVHAKVVEGGKERVQVFEGVVIATKQGNDARDSFTVRKVSKRRGHRACVFAELAAYRQDRRYSPRRRAPRQAVLSAHQGRQGGSYQGEAVPDPGAASRGQTGPGRSVSGSSGGCDASSSLVFELRGFAGSSIAHPRYAFSS